MSDVKPSEITPEHLYLSRRRFLAGGSALAAGALASACGLGPQAPTAAVPAGGTPVSDELGNPATAYASATGYNNFFEFSLDKEDVASRAQGFRTSPWTVEVGGLVAQPRTFGVEDLLKAFPQEERIYRFRCVEAWSMVIPWTGFPLAGLLKQVEPLPSAKFVRFETLLDAEQMPGQKGQFFEWPYVEGLRLDEAMHDLTIMATGLYGKPAPAQNGAPIRLVVPWKYGFKSIKSIVKIDLVAEMPTSFWTASAPDEYGFYANVNPQVSHPRWSQASERRIGGTGRIDTLLFNGYADRVADLYAGMDLRKYF